MTVVTPPRPEIPSRPPTSRRFGLLDAMILVAATAVGLAADRVLGTAGGAMGLRELIEYRPGERTAVAAFRHATMAIAASWPLMAAWTLAVLTSTLRGPRPRRRLARRPGPVAGLALVPTLALCTLPAMVTWSCTGSFGGPYLVRHVMASSGTTVLGAWGLLLVGGRWLPEPTWTDRLGVFFGVYWIVAALMVAAFGQIPG